MTPTRLFSTIGAALCLALPARADLTLVQTTTISNPQITAALQSMSAQQRAQVQKSSPFFSVAPRTAKIYMQGHRSRIDYANYTYVFDTATKTLLTLNRTTKTFSVRMITSPQNQKVSGATLTDTHETKTILGHRAHHYIVATANVAGAGSQLRADIWAAPDLPHPPDYGQGGGPQASMQALLRQVKGLPLVTTIVLAGSPIGTVTTRAVATSVSTTALSPALFTVPAGFKSGATGDLGGGIGFGH